MNVSEVEFYGWLTTELSDYLDVGSVESMKDVSLPVLGLDSLEIVELFMKVEDRFGVPLPMDSLSDYMTLGELWVCFDKVANKTCS